MKTIEKRKKLVAEAAVVGKKTILKYFKAQSKKELRWR